MGLAIDRVFIKALRESGYVVKTVGNRIFDPERDIEAEAEDKVPYIVVCLESVTNQSQSKDAIGEDDEDTAVVSVLVVADDREGLAQLATSVREAIQESLTSDRYVDSPTDTGPSVMCTGLDFAAGRVEYDADKPCCYQTLTYTLTIYRV